MEHLTPEEAKARGYRAITGDILPKMEEQIVTSLEISLRGVDAVWIDLPCGRIHAARRATEIRLPEAVLNDIKKQNDQ